MKADKKESKRAFLHVRPIIHQASLVRHMVEFVEPRSWRAGTLYILVGQDTTQHNACTHHRGCLTGCAEGVQRAGHRQDQEDGQLHAAAAAAGPSQRPCSPLPARALHAEWVRGFAQYHGSEVPIRSGSYFGGGAARGSCGVSL